MFQLLPLYQTIGLLGGSHRLIHSDSLEIRGTMTNELKNVVEKVMHDRYNIKTGMHIFALEPLTILLSSTKGPLVLVRDGTDATRPSGC